MADDNILQAEIDRLTEANAALEEKLRIANSNYYKAVSEREAAKKDRREEVADALTREQHWKRIATEAMEVSAAREALMNSGHWHTAISNLKTALEGLKYHIGNAAEFWIKECHSSRDAFERLESDVERLRNDKIVANGLIANLEGLAAADGEKIRDLESKLETVAASRERSIDDYNKSVAREGRLREEIQRINLRLADAEHERVRLRKQLDGQREIAGVESAQLRRELAAAHDLLCKLNAASVPPVVISKSDYGAVEVDAALKERDQWRAEAQGLRKVVNERNEALDEARIDEKRSTDEMCRFQRKLHKIYLITIDADGDK